MKPCFKCNGEKWDYKRVDGDIIIARCLQCGNKVSWSVAPRIHNEYHVGDPCRNPLCHGKLILRKSSDFPDRKHSGRWSAWYYCPECRRVYFDQKFLIIKRKNMKEVFKPGEIVRHKLNGAKFIVLDRTGFGETIRPMARLRKEDLTEIWLDEDELMPIK